MVELHGDHATSGGDVQSAAALSLPEERCPPVFGELPGAEAVQAAIAEATAALPAAAEPAETSALSCSEEGGDETPYYGSYASAHSRSMDEDEGRSLPPASAMRMPQKPGVLRKDPSRYFTSPATVAAPTAPSAPKEFPSACSVPKLPPKSNLGMRRTLTLDLTGLQTKREVVTTSLSSSSISGIVSPVKPKRCPGNRISDFTSAFKVGAVLGQGTMALVRQGTRRSDGGQVAVKCIRCEDEELQQFTRDEYELIRSLRHPSILAVESLFEDQTTQWLVMEFCAGGSVDQHVENSGPLREIEARGLAVQLLQGVNYLHKKRIVHRDLKPANLLLHTGVRQREDSITTLKIADFNSAKQIGRGPGSSLMLTDRGTHIYAAPELRFGCLWNERVDIWACGLCIYYFLRACLPFIITHRSISTQLLSGELPPINWQGMPQLMKNLVQQCLIVQMHDRPPAMQLLLHPAFEDSASEQWSHLFDDEPVSPYAEQEEPRAEARDHFALLPACGCLAMAKRASPKDKKRRGGAFERQCTEETFNSPRTPMLSPRALSSPLLHWGDSEPEQPKARWMLGFNSLRLVALRKTRIFA